MWPQNRSTTFDLFKHLRRYTIKIKRNLKHFLLFLRNAQAIHEMPRGKYFCQCTYCLQNLSITCIAYSFSPLHEMPDIFRHFMKCFTSRIACTIYIYIFKRSIYNLLWCLSMEQATPNCRILSLTQLLEAKLRVCLEVKLYIAWTVTETCSERQTSRQVEGGGRAVPLVI